MVHFDGRLSLGDGQTDHLVLFFTCKPLLFEQLGIDTKGFISYKCGRFSFCVTHLLKESRYSSSFFDGGIYDQIRYSLRRRECDETRNQGPYCRARYSAVMRRSVGPNFEVASGST